MGDLIKIRNLILLLLGIASTVGYALHQFPHVSDKTSRLYDLDGKYLIQTLRKTSIRSKVSQNESFWEFFYRYIGDPRFRDMRTKIPLTETQKELNQNVLQYGRFLMQDSLQSHWIYSLTYKDLNVTYDFKKQSGRWYLVNLD